MLNKTNIIQINSLSQRIHGTTPLPLAPTPSFSGELFGAEYLYNQTGQRVLDSNNLDERIDEGFGDVEEEEEEEDLAFGETELQTVASPDDVSEGEDPGMDEEVCSKKKK